MAKIATNYYETILIDFNASEQNKYKECFNMINVTMSHPFCKCDMRAVNNIKCLKCACTYCFCALIFSAAEFETFNAIANYPLAMPVSNYSVSKSSCYNFNPQ